VPRHHAIMRSTCDRRTRVQHPTSSAPHRLLCSGGSDCAAAAWGSEKPSRAEQSLRAAAPPQPCLMSPPVKLFMRAPQPTPAARLRLERRRTAPRPPLGQTRARLMTVLADLALQSSTPTPRQVMHANMGAVCNPSRARSIQWACRGAVLCCVRWLRSNRSPSDHCLPVAAACSR